MKDLLSALTPVADLCAMTISLWLAFYMLGKGFPNKIALRAVVVFLSLSVFFFEAYDSQFYQTKWAADLRAIAIVLTLATWYSLTFQMILGSVTKRTRLYKMAVYSSGTLATLLLIIVRNSFVGDQGTALEVARMELGFPYAVYGLFLILSGAGILYNLLSRDRVGLQPQGYYFLIASLLACIGAVYGLFTLAITNPMPRLILDLFAFGSVLLLGIAVARQQALIDRRITLADVPVSAITIPGLASVYALIAWEAGYGSRIIAAVMAFAILTHSIHDLAREFLERSRLRNESAFRRKLWQLDGNSFTENNFRYRFKVGLGLLCQTLQASGGFIAIRQGGEFIVVASRQSSLQIDRRLDPALVACEDISQSTNSQLPGIAWIAPAFEGQTQVAVIGIGKPKTRMNYSSDDLDVLGEVTDQIGTLVSLNNTKVEKTPANDTNISDLSVSADEMMMAIASNPDQEFVKTVEEGLRHLSDYITLGRSPLADQLGIKGESHVERGKLLSGIIMESIESLRPSGMRPHEPLPRVWYNYAVLYDAYVEGVPNREIMARLYVSEGTFHRTRRNAMRGLTRLLLEKSRVAV